MNVDVFYATGEEKLFSDHGALTGLLEGDDHTQYPIITSGSGNPSSTPARAGAIYIDTTNDIAYIAVGASSSSDWKPAGARALTAALRDAISSPLTGLEIYNTDVHVKEAYDTQRWKALSDIAWGPTGYALAHDGADDYAVGLNLAANGGSGAVPIIVPSHMLLQSASVYNGNATLERTWGWDLYEQYLNNGNSGENTLTRVAASNADETFTPGVASMRTINAASAPVYLRPGLYWLVIQCRHASNNFSVGETAASASFSMNQWQTKTTTNPNGSTLDFVAATWSKRTSIPGVGLNGRVFGQTSAF